MTELSRPVVAMLGSTVETTGPTERHDIERLRESLTVALRRCLDAPDARWLDLVERGAAVGTWDEWRVASLVAAVEPSSDPEPEVTRDVLATLTEELIGRRDVLPGPWEGAERQVAVESPRWRAGLRRREIIFTIERAVACVEALDADGLRLCAARVTERGGDDAYPGLAVALVACAEEAASGTLSRTSLTPLRAALAATPFASAIDRISTGV